MPIRDEMQVLMDRWTKGFVEGDIETCVDVYTKDAAVYSPYSEPKCGSDGIRDLFDQWHQQGTDALGAFSHPLLIEHVWLRSVVQV